MALMHGSPCFPGIEAALVVAARDVFQTATDLCAFEAEAGGSADRRWLYRCAVSATELAKTKLHLLAGRCSGSSVALFSACSLAAVGAGRSENWY